MKRFYKHVSTRPDASGFYIELDGKPVLTPGRVQLKLPTRTLAAAVADEWSNQDKIVEPNTMPLTRHANSVLDRIQPRHAEVAATISAYAQSDSLCYRAEYPVDLVDLQMQTWDPLLAWANTIYNVKLVVSHGINPQQQSADSIDTLTQAVEALTDWQLSGLHTIASISSSLIIGLALIRGDISIETAWHAGLLEELYQVNRWGSDTLATASLKTKRHDMESAVQWLRLLQEEFS